MTNRLVTTDIWAKITATVKQKPSRCFVAVAYFGTGASKLLPLGKGSTLIVDMSQAAVGSGQTNPSEILKLVNRGVDVHSVENLHAKVFVVGEQVFIGSTNVSNSSAHGLVEADLQTTNRSVVAACRKFVRDLRGELVTPEHAKKMQKLYHPPKFGHGTPKPTNGGGQPTKHSPLWAIPINWEEWDEADKAAEQEALPTAKLKIESPTRFVLDEFCCAGGSLPKRIKRRDLIIEVFDRGHGRKMVVPQARVIHVKPYKVGRENRAIVFVERAKQLRQKNLKAVIGQLGPKARELKNLSVAKVIRDRAFAHALLNLWRNADGQ
jgi:hypothetical protein